MAPLESYSYEALTEGSTGSIPVEEEQRLVLIPHGPYNVVVRVTDEGRLVDVVEVCVNRDFLSPEQRVASSGYFDVEEYYKEE